MATVELPLENHPFFLRQRELVVAFMRDVAGEPTLEDRYPQKRLSLPKEEWAHTVFQTAAEVLQLLQQMTYTPAFLGSYRSTPGFEKVGVTRFEYLIYQLENWFIRCTALLDRSLILTNTVCKLGFRTRDCKLHLITSNAHVNGSPIDSALRALDKQLRVEREIRNSISHHKRLQPEGWSELEGLAIMVRLEPESFPAHRLKRRLDEAVAEQKSQKVQQLEEFMKLVGDLFTALLPRFERNYV